MGAKIGTRDEAKRFEGTEEFPATINMMEDYMSIFESQMNNPYLCKDDSMFGFWINAFVHINVLGHMGVFDNAHDSYFDKREPSRIDELSLIPLNRDYLSVWDAINKAYLYCGRKIKTEKLNFIKN